MERKTHVEPTKITITRLLPKNEKTEKYIAGEDPKFETDRERERYGFDYGNPSMLTGFSWPKELRTYEDSPVPGFISETRASERYGASNETEQESEIRLFGFRPIAPSKKEEAFLQLANLLKSGYRLLTAEELMRLRLREFPVHVHNRNARICSLEGEREIPYFGTTWDFESLSTSDVLFCTPNGGGIILDGLHPKGDLAQRVMENPLKVKEEVNWEQWRSVLQGGSSQTGSLSRDYSELEAGEHPILNTLARKDLIEIYAHCLRKWVNSYEPGRDNGSNEVSILMYPCVRKEVEKNPQLSGEKYKDSVRRAWTSVSLDLCPTNHGFTEFGNNGFSLLPLDSMKINSARVDWHYWIAKKDE